MSRNVSQKFAAFAGRTVTATEHNETLRLGENTYTLVNIIVDENCAAIAELTAAVKAARLQLRLNIPGTANTTDFQPNRVNAYLEKGDDGTYRLGAKFDLG